MKHFVCGVTEIDAWVKNKCVKHHSQNRTRVFIARETDSLTTIGFYCLSFTSPSESNLEDTQYRDIYKGSGIPIVYIQYIAVARSCQRNGLGKMLLVDALRRSLHVATHVAFYGIGIRPINEDAARLYRSFGFKAKDEAEKHPLMILPIWTVADLFKIKL